MFAVSGWANFGEALTSRQKAGQAASQARAL